MRVVLIRRGPSTWLPLCRLDSDVANADTGSTTGRSSRIFALMQLSSVCCLGSSEKLVVFQVSLFRQGQFLPHFDCDAAQTPLLVVLAKCHLQDQGRNDECHLAPQPLSWSFRSPTAACLWWVDLGELEEQVLLARVASVSGASEKGAEVKWKVSRSVQLLSLHVLCHLAWQSV